jgi:hypothetical protein
VFLDGPRGIRAFWMCIDRKEERERQEERESKTLPTN